MVQSKRCVLSNSLIDVLLCFFVFTIFHYLLQQVHWVRIRSLQNPNKILNEHNSLSFPGNRNHSIVPRLEPFSEYKLTVHVFNKKGNGPKSELVTFNTSEGGKDAQMYTHAHPAANNTLDLIYLLLLNVIVTGSMRGTNTKKEQNNMFLFICSMTIIIHSHSSKPSAHPDCLQHPGELHFAGMGTTSGVKWHPFWLPPPVPPQYVQ